MSYYHLNDSKDSQSPMGSSRLCCNVFNTVYRPRVDNLTQPSFRDRLVQIVWLFNSL